MGLKQWLKNRWIHHHNTTKEEIRNLIDIVERDLKEAKQPITADWQFGIAYNAALKLCTILVYAEGYKPEKTSQHYRYISALPLIIGKDKKNDAEYLNTCRAKRNIIEYDSIGSVTENDADELIEFTKKLKKEVISWLKKYHSEFYLE